MRHTDQTYLERLSEDLASIETRFLEMLETSTIETLEEEGVVFINAAPKTWGPDSPETQSLRMGLTRTYNEWIAPVRLLFPHPTPDVTAELEGLDGWIRLWLDRNSLADFTVPGTMEESKDVAREQFQRFRSLLKLAALGGEPGLHVVPDTNSLIHNPDFASYSRAVETDRFTLHITTTVLAELDDLKNFGRDGVRKKAQNVVRRLKGLRDKGSLAAGVNVTRNIVVKTVNSDLDPSTVLDWFDKDVNDHRLLAAALRLQSDNPAGTVVLVTSDLNLQNKADAVRLPYRETPKTDSELTATFDHAVTRESVESGTRLVLTFENVGEVTAYDVRYRITEPEGTKGPVCTAGPWSVDRFPPKDVHRQPVTGFFSDPHLIASWNDEAGENTKSWPIEFPPDPPPRLSSTHLGR